MKVALNIEIDTPLKDYDVIVYDKVRKKWVATSRERFLRTTTGKIIETNNRIDEIIASQERFKQGVNQKLKEYHDILQNLVKENE